MSWRVIRAGAVLLMAMGYDALSMNAANLPKVKSVIAQRHPRLGHASCWMMS